MCWMCDHPGSTYQDWLDHVRGLMLRHGWAVQYVGRDGIRAPFAYTVGLSELGLPELLATGLAPPRATALLNRAADRVLEGHLPAPGEVLEVAGLPPLEVVMVEHPDAHLYTAVALFGVGIQALQLVWADGRGRWPWQVDFRGRRGGQPVLGARARHQ
jgi:hypothetical protein